MVIKEESGLKFGFPEKSIVIKFDDTLFIEIISIDFQDQRVSILFL